MVRRQKWRLVADIGGTNARLGVCAGGIVPRIFDFIDVEEFRRRFEAKGRFRNYLASIPVRIIHREHVGLFGAVRYLSTSEDR